MTEPGTTATMRWVRISAEQISALCALAPARAALALRNALQENTLIVACTDCEQTFDVHGDLAGVNGAECPVCGGRLEITP